MTSPNVNASPESIANEVDGIDGNGNQLPWRKVAMFYEAEVFGLASTYAFPEGSNESSSFCDQITSLAKLETRKKTLADGNQYDLWDMLVTNTKWILSQNIHINDDEPLSVNYKKA